MDYRDLPACDPSDISDCGYDDFSEDAVMHYYNSKYGRDDDDSTVSSNRKKHRKMMEDLKKADKGYNKISRIINNKKQSIEVYATSNTPGTMIRDAVTGSRFKEFRVGSLNEYQFFKVRMATGQMNGYSSTLFFDSPEQYERHMKTEVSPDLKDDWSKRCADIRNSEYVPKNTSGFVVVK